MIDPDILALAVDLAASAGAPRPRSVDRLAGGQNNRVFRVATAGEPLVLKLYHDDPRDPRDRLGAEWAFLAYVRARGVATVPVPLAHDPGRHAALYGFVAGRRPGAVDGAAVEAAAAFVVAANAAPRNPRALNPGSEACFCLSDHLATVARRVERLGRLDPDVPLRDRAERLVADALRPAWAAVEAQIRGRMARAGLDPDRRLDPVEEIVSPSDFGFHNALVTDDGRTTFIDFEYAGRDDPAKLVCDFFCCPEVPVPDAYRPAFAARIAAVEGLADTAQRAELLIDAYRIKWVCILLNDFLPLGGSRRAFALAGERERRCAAQLEKAGHALAAVGAAA